MRFEQMRDLFGGLGGLGFRMDVTSELKKENAPRRQDPDRGLYKPTDMLWQVHSEFLLMLGGARSVMLEIAHPLIAAGVAHHSNFRRNPLKRLFGTVRTMILLTFGDGRMAQIAAQHTNRCHTNVHGTLDETVGSTQAGTHYSATDPALRLWVFATLVDSNLLVHDLFVRPLNVEEKSAYYEDSKRMAHMLGVPPRVMPPTYADFQQYMQEMFDGDALSVGAEGRDVMHGLLYHPLLGGIVRLASYASIGLLPDRIREEFGYAWNERDEKFLRWLIATVRRIRGFIPELFFRFPAATYYALRYRNDVYYK
jgi:uncharacterized protein (DUF2236 family)